MLSLFSCLKSYEFFSFDIVTVKNDWNDVKIFLHYPIDSVLDPLNMVGDLTIISAGHYMDVYVFVNTKVSHSRANWADRYTKLRVPWSRIF